MHRDELVKEAVDRVLDEMSWTQIEEVFRPLNGLELLLRLDFEGMVQKVNEFFSDNSPRALPHRVRAGYWTEINRAVEIERFYRELCAARKQREMVDVT